MQLQIQHDNKFNKFTNSVIFKGSLGMFVNGVHYWRILWEASNQ